MGREKRASLLGEALAMVGSAAYGRCGRYKRIYRLIDEFLDVSVVMFAGSTK